MPECVSACVSNYSPPTPSKQGKMLAAARRLLKAKLGCLENQIDFSVFDISLSLDIGYVVATLEELEEAEA